MRINKLISLSFVMVAAVAVSTAPAFAAKKKLVFWVNDFPIWRQVAKEYMKQNPSVEISIASGALDKYYAMVSAGLMPDLWGPWGSAGITADVNRNWALDLTPYLKRDGQSMDLNDFFPGLMRKYRVRGKQYALPLFYYADWYFYDPQKYGEAGLAVPAADPDDKSWTWERMVANAKKIAKYDASGVVVQPGLEFRNRYPDQSIANWINLWDANPYSKEALATSIPQDIALNTPEMITALTNAWELIYKHKVSSRNLTSVTAAPTKVGSSIEPGYEVRELMRLKNARWALAPLPYAKTNSGTMWPDGIVISRISKNKDLAWDFVKFMCSPKMMALIINDSKSNYQGSGVSRKSVFYNTMAQNVAKATKMTPDDVLKIYWGQDEVGVIKEQDTICLQVDLWSNYLSPIMPELWSNKISPGQCAAKLQAQANKALPVLFQRWVRNVKFAGTGVKP